MSHVAGRALRVDVPGPLCTVQDLGRPGLAHLGVGRSGAADRAALVRANRLVGNPDAAAGLEITLGGLRLTALTDARLAFAGATVPISVDRVERRGSILELAAGQQLRLGRPPIGLRSYVAVAGGIDVTPILGSRSTDTLSGLGPDPLTAGTTLPVGNPTLTTPDGDPAAAPRESADTVVLDAVLGPQDALFPPAAFERLARTTWTVGADANRVGLHLTGPGLNRRALGEIPSEPMVAGAIQVPPSGKPVMFLADHPVTGGYPVIAVLTGAAVDLAAQLRPGRTLRIRPVRDPLTGSPEYR